MIGRTAGSYGLVLACWLPPNLLRSQLLINERV
jgi:hypothetical protein